MGVFEKVQSVGVILHCVFARGHCVPAIHRPPSEKNNILLKSKRAKLIPT